MGKESVKEKSRSGKSRVRTLLLILIVGAFLGYYFGFRLPEERRNRLQKLIGEAREMPFRLYV